MVRDLAGGGPGCGPRARPPPRRLLGVPTPSRSRPRARPARQSTPSARGLSRGRPRVGPGPA
eukprot:9424379-Alexandrium_andersonii.AAC.1